MVQSTGGGRVASVAPCATASCREREPMTSTNSEPPLPQGPALTIERLDEWFDDFEAPMWGNVNVFYGGMQLTGFATEVGDLLVFQSIITLSSTLYEGIQREIAACVPADSPLAEAAPVDPEQLVANDQLFAHAAGRVSSRLTGVTMEWGPPAKLVGPFPDSPPTAFEVDLLGERVTVSLTLAGFAELDASEQERLTQLEPAELLTVRLAQAPWRDRVFLSPARLAERLGLTGRVVPVLECSAWLQHDPDPELFDTTASASPDLVAIVDALADRRPLGRLPRGTGPLAQIAAWRDSPDPLPSLWGPAGSPLRQQLSLPAADS